MQAVLCVLRCNTEASFVSDGGKMGVIRWEFENFCGVYILFTLHKTTLAASAAST